MTRFYLISGNFLADEHYETREEAEKVVEGINRGLEDFGTTSRHGVVEVAG